MDHSQHMAHPESTAKDYTYFVCILIFIGLSAYGLTIAQGWSISLLLRMIMGMFFLVFALFKLIDLSGFALSFPSYDLIAKKWMGYGYVYPCIELFLAAGNFAAWPFIDWLTIIFMAIGAAGVLRALFRPGKIRCACLGTYINLPLSTVSLVEYVAMGVMALVMLLLY